MMTIILLLLVLDASSVGHGTTTLQHLIMTAKTVVELQVLLINAVVQFRISTAIVELCFVVAVCE